MKTVAELLRSKPDHAVYTVSPATFVFDAVKLMADKNIGALMVIDGEKIVGIFTERDYARKIILLGKASKETPVRDIMTSSVISVHPSQTNEECMALTTGHRVRHLPVLVNGKLGGLISIGDLVKDIISEQKFIIEQLIHYITS